MENLEAVDGEEAADDAFLEPRPQHDHVVLLIHLAAMGRSIDLTLSASPLPGGLPYIGPAGHARRKGSLPPAAKSLEPVAAARNTSRATPAAVSVFAG